jgi:hypothetical protein
MKSKRGKQMMTVKRKTDAVARVLDRLAELKINKPRAQKKSRPRTRKPKNLKNESGFAQVSTSSVPAAFGSTTKIQKPNFGRARTIIKHSEYIGDVLGSVNFTVAMTLNCNPGLPNSFPWLSQIANAYQKFCIKTLQYRFNTEAPSTITGSIFLSPEYNPQDLPPVTKMETFQNENTAKTVPWRNVNCVVPTKYLRVYNDYFVRPGGLSANQDLKTYDPLVLYVCTQGQANTNMCGEIWVDYEIELINPIGNMAYGGGTSKSTSALLSSTNLMAGMNGVGPIQFSTTGTANQVSMSPLVVGNVYQFTHGIIGSVISALVAAPVSGATNFTTSFGVSNINSTATVAAIVYTFTASATTAVLSELCTATTVTTSDFSIYSEPVGSLW